MKKFLLFISIVMSFFAGNACAQSFNVESAPIMVFDANENLIDQTYGKLSIWTDYSDSPSLVVLLEGLSSSKVEQNYCFIFNRSSSCTRRGDVLQGDDVLELSRQWPDGSQTLTGLVSAPVEGAPSGYNRQLYFARVNSQGSLDFQLVVALTGQQWIDAIVYLMGEVKDKGVVPFTQY